ncbi:hypothetical protein WJX77_003367 [Trebouxia sp. C0004]
MGLRSALASGFKKVTGAVFERPSNTRTVFKVNPGTHWNSKHQSATTIRRAASIANALDDSFYEEALNMAHYATGVLIDHQLENRPLTQATLEQEQTVQNVYARMVAVLHGCESAQMDIDEFSAALQHAANADVLGVWPFRGSSGLDTNIVSCKYNIGDLVHAACAMQQLDHVLPHLEVLLQTARMIPVAKSLCLEDTLVLLAEAHSLPNACPEIKGRICRIMNQWALMPIPVENNIIVWSDEPQPARIGSNKRDVVLMSVGQLTQQRLYTSDVSPAAAVQQSSSLPISSQIALSASPEATNPAEPAHKAPQETAANDFISRAEAEKAVAEAVAAAVSKEREDADKMIKVLTRRPNDKWMVRNYCRRHTNQFYHDFNADMLKKRRQKLEAQQASTQSSNDVDVCVFSSMLATVDDADDGYI